MTVPITLAEVVPPVTTVSLISPVLARTGALATDVNVSAQIQGESARRTAGKLKKSEKLEFLFHNFYNSF